MTPTYLEACAGVRYWEDATVNGAEDTSGVLIPLRVADNWCPTIRLADGLVMDWPQGTTADIHYKVCDAGEYWLLDDKRRRVAKWVGDYVPDKFLSPTEPGGGDYIILKVSGDGLIENWEAPEVRMVCRGDQGDRYGWVEV